MRRREFVAAAVGGFAIACGTSGVCAGIEPALLTATDVHPANYPTVAAVRWIGETLERESAGELLIRQYHSGQLGRESDAVEMTRFGAIDITRVYTGAVNNAFPLTRALCLPYVFDSIAHLRRTLDGPVGRSVLDGFSRRGLVGLAIYDCGARCFYNTRREVRVPGDLTGLKLRVPPSDIFMNMLRLFGANPTPLAYGDVFSALETRLIDGAENNIRSFHASRHFEGAQFWAQSAHCHAPDVLLMSAQRFNALGAKHQELVRDVATRSVQHMRQLWDEGEAVAREAVIAGGVHMSDVDLPMFARAVKPLVDQFRSDASIEQLYRGIRAMA